MTRPLLAVAALCMLLAGCGPARPARQLTPTPAQAPVPSPAAPALAAVPDLRGSSLAAAADLLAPIGLRLGQRYSSCAALGAQPAPGPVGSILCQAIPPGSMAPVGLPVDYVVFEGDS
jgi:hypothetical protein